MYGTTSGKTEIVKSVCGANSSKKGRGFNFTWMRRTVDYDIQCFVDMRDKGHAPQLKTSEEGNRKIDIEDLSTSILDAFGKSYLYTLDEQHVSARERLQQLLTKHTAKRKLIIISHLDWIFNDDSLQTKETFETFIQSLTQTNTSFIFTICGMPKHGFSESFPFQGFHVRAPILDEKKRGLICHLEQALGQLPDYQEDEHAEVFEHILRVSNFKMELLNTIIEEIIEQSNFPRAPFDLTQFLEDLKSCMNVNEMAMKLTANFTEDEQKLLQFLRLFPIYFRYDDCLCVKDDSFTEEKIKRALTSLFQKKFVKQSKPGMFMLSDFLRESMNFRAIPTDFKRMFIVSTLLGFSRPTQHVDPVVMVSQRRNLRMALALMDLGNPDVSCFQEWGEIRAMVLQIGVENFPNILENMMSNLGNRFVLFFKNILKKCEEELQNGSVEEAWLKVVLKSFNGQWQVSASDQSMLVICFEKYMGIAERVRDSGEEHWDDLKAELEAVKREMLSCEGIDKDYASKLNSQIDPLLKQLRCFQSIYNEMNEFLDQIHDGKIDISRSVSQRTIEEKIKEGMKSPCNFLKETAVRLKVSAEIKMKSLAGTEEVKRAKEQIENEHKGNIAALQEELNELKASSEAMKANHVTELTKLQTERAKWEADKTKLETLNARVLAQMEKLYDEKRELSTLNGCLEKEVVELRTNLSHEQELVMCLKEREVVRLKDAKKAKKIMDKKEKGNRKKEKNKGKKPGKLLESRVQLALPILRKAKRPEPKLPLLKRENVYLA